LGVIKRLFSPALVRYILDPDNSVGQIAVNRSIVAKKQRFELNSSNINRIREDYSFLQRIILKIKSISGSNKRFELYKQK